jgi:hypothetical protein
MHSATPGFVLLHGNLQIKKISLEGAIPNKTEVAV